MADLSGDERAELERLRRLQELSASTGAVRTGGGAGRAWGLAGRWVAASALLLIAAVLASASVVAVYVRDEVLNTDTFVQTVAPLASDPTVRTAVARRLTDEIVRRSDLQGLATTLADKLEAQGAPARLSDLVQPLVSGVSSFLNNKINDLLATQRFEDAWRNINRIAHQGVVTVLTGQQGQLLSSQGNTVTLDLGELLSLVKQQLVSEGLTIFGKIPDVSITYPLIESRELPKVRTYTKLLNTAGTWLPWVALVLLLFGVLVAPNRRRGIVLAATLVALVTALVLGGVTAARTYYVDNLPPQITSPDAAAVVLSTILRFLIASLQTLLVASLILLVGALLAGPSAVAVGIRRLLNKGLDALAGYLRRAGAWALSTGRVLRSAYHPVQIAVVLVGIVGLIIAHRPSIAAVLWTTVVVLLALIVVEVFVRVGSARPGPAA
jgi:hypothetical protein